jgi:hypothetical protein
MCKQVLHTRILVATMALPTPHTANTKVENAMEDILEAARLPRSKYRTNGGNARTLRSTKPTFSPSIHDSDDSFHYMRPHSCWWVLVCRG